MDAIAEIQARLEIETTFARYAHTIDSYDALGWVDCFAADGVFEVSGHDGSSICFVGHETLTRFAEAHIRLLPGTRHVMTNHITEFENDTEARHVCTLSGTLSRPETVYIFVSGWYDSRVVLDDGHWRIRHRTVHIDNRETFVSGALAEHMQPFMNWAAENGTAG
jgi:ketosteroid isomerase-like protein